jgi:hypothetical protein
MTIYDTLRESILSQRPCRISRSGQPERKVCPYRIGKSSEGDLNVLYYQYAGYSESGLRPAGSNANWRCNRISEITTAEIMDEAWRQPLQKPETRGTCVISSDIEVKDYY